MSSIEGTKTTWNPVLVEISLTPIFVEDFRLGGYTVYFKEFPDIISEGETQDEALKNIKNTVFDVFKYKNTLPDETKGIF
jgi:predicted RNase H-like HicB family nuclease